MKPHRELYRVDNLPTFQNRMYRTAADARACPRGDVLLVEDLETGLVYNRTFRPELMIYDASYQNEQGVSAVFQRHLDAVAELIERTMGRGALLEIGCGKGLFLELLEGQGFDIRGVDPTYEGTNPRITKQYFSAGLGLRGDGLILRHVLEHIPDPVGFLSEIKVANGGGGKIYIEVPCFDWICDHDAWFDIFYEHVNYFRLSDFRRMFGTVYEAERSFGGQYLSVVADLATLRCPTRDPSDSIAFPSDFGTTNLTLRNGSAIWGAASKGVVFSLMMERAGVEAGAVIDINPAKQGRFMAASGLEVQSPEQGLARLSDGATIYVMNSNYLTEIRDMSGNRFTYVEIDR